LQPGKLHALTDPNFISNHDTLGVVNRFAVGASARLFLSSKHRRSLSCAKSCAESLFLFRQKTIAVETGCATLPRMKVKFGLTEVLLIISVATLLYLWNWQAVVFVLIVLAYAIFRYYKPTKGEPPTLLKR
jgi:hypothetical protein